MRNNDRDILDGTHEARAALVLRDAHSTTRFRRLQTRLNGARDNGCSPVFRTKNDGLLPDGPDNDKQFVNSWKVISESVSEARFDVGRPGKMWAAPRV